MAYSDFTYAEAIRKFGLTLDTRPDLFAAVPPVAADPVARAAIERFASVALAINTEKARSEMLIAPVLGEVWRQAAYRVSYYSGTAFPVDPDLGLTGTADYVFTRGPQIPDITAPVLVVVEGKNESIAAGYGQCISLLVAALRLNRRENTGTETVYGCVTIGDNWKFLRLHGTDLAIDRQEYQIAQLDKLIGIFLFAVGEHPQMKAAA
jgi:hypothetical protein